MVDPPLPLERVCVLVTRPRRQAASLVHRLAALGAEPLVLPAVEVREPPDWGPVDGALAGLPQYQWVVFTGVNAVRAFVSRLRQSGRDPGALRSLRLAAIGPATAAALREYQLDAPLVPPEFRSESLAASLRAEAAGQRVLLVRADRGRDVLREELSRVAHVDQVAVYSQVDAFDPHAPELEAWRRGRLRYVTLTSSNIARALLGGVDAVCRARVEAGDVKLVTISPVTSAAVRELGLSVAAEAAVYTMAGLVDALVAHYRGRSKRGEMPT
jgi:uroporphyrinogen III methyltransferase/synthase